MFLHLFIFFTSFGASIKFITLALIQYVLWWFRWPTCSSMYSQSKYICLLGLKYASRSSTIWRFFESILRRWRLIGWHWGPPVNLEGPPVHSYTCAHVDPWCVQVDPVHTWTLLVHTWTLPVHTWTLPVHTWTLGLCTGGPCAYVDPEPVHWWTLDICAQVGPNQTLVEQLSNHLPTTLSA